MIGILKNWRENKIPRIYVADTIVNLINVYDPDGKFLFKFGPKDERKLSYPRGVTVTPSGMVMPLGV